MNLVEYLVSKGFKMTSDPNKYASGVWGLRNYTVNGYNYDNFCDGFHRAYDFAKSHLAGIPSICDGIVVSGTKAYGNFGGTVVIASKELGIQVIYGHLDRNLMVSIGQEVKQGQIIGKQSNTNYAGVYMDSHLHIQMQSYNYYDTEKDFVCSGINPLNIDLNKGQKIPTTSSKVHTVKKGDSLYRLSKKYKTSVSILRKINNLQSNTIKVGQVLKIKGSTIPLVTEKPKVVVEKKTFNPNKDRGRSLNSYVIGKIDSLGAEVRKRKGSKVKGFNWNTKAGYSLKSGEVVHIFEVHKGWGRIYTGKLTGKGSNDWIWLGRMNVTKINK